ncbi:alpha/beta fold hydrolase [Micromonospora sp. BRA006-A]|nr:alpha/beta fold hydrolase [Micromonospora sp. BRA006-A]
MGYDYDTFAADLDVLMTELDLRNAILVGHSMGTGEVTRYLGAYGSDRVDRAVLMAPLAPYLLKAPDDPEGVDKSMFDGFQKAIIQDRFAYLTQFCDAFFNASENRGRWSATRRTTRTGRSARRRRPRAPTTRWTPGRPTSAPTCRTSTCRC